MLDTPPRGLTPNPPPKRGALIPEGTRDCGNHMELAPTPRPFPRARLPASLVLRGPLPACVRIPQCPTLSSTPSSAHCCRQCVSAFDPASQDSRSAASPPPSRVTGQHSGPPRHTSASPAACFPPFLLQHGPPQHTPPPQGLTSWALALDSSLF